MSLLYCHNNNSGHRRPLYLHPALILENAMATIPPNNHNKPCGSG